MIIPSCCFCCTVDEVDKRKPKPDTPQRAAYDLAEVKAKLEVAGGFGSKKLKTEEKAEKALGQLLRALGQLLKEHPYLPAEKRLYIEYGCRGDWPELQPKEWSPVLSALGRRPAAPAGQSSFDQQ